MKAGNLLKVGMALAAVGTISVWSFAQERKAPGTGVGVSASRPASRPHERFRMPEPIAQTIERQNSPQDKLRIDLTHSYSREGGRHVAFVRILWGDLDNVIKNGGKRYYSDWDGQLKVDKGEAEVIRKIAFDEGTRPTSRPASGPMLHRGLREHGGTARPMFHRERPASRPSAEPGPGSGRDELIKASGNPIVWKAGVVGALDGLMIKITSETGEMTGTIKAGKFDVPFKITPAPTPAAH